MENFKENLSEEQRERQEKLEELSKMMSSISESFTNSDDAYEVGTFINDFKKEFETGDLRLKDYLLGGVLLSSEDAFDVINYPYYDTEDGAIEKFIRELYKYQQEKKP